jgi:hypothetical protein
MLPSIRDEHSCGIYHYGDQSIVRDCCVEHCREMARLTLAKALTTSHPAYRAYIEAWNELTDSEMALVPNIVYCGNFNGFKDIR